MAGRQRIPDHIRESRQHLAELLKARGPLTAEAATNDILAAETVPAPIADRMMETFVGDDQRFQRLPDGRWSYRDSDEHERLIDSEFVVLDVETTGTRPPADRITELGAVRVRGGALLDEFVTLMDPEREIPLDASRLTGITNEMVTGKPTALEVFPEFAEWLGDAMVVAHNAHFDRYFIDSHWRDVFGESNPNVWICSVQLARKLYPKLKSRSLGPLCDEFGISSDALHRAGNDARATANVFLRELDDLAARGIVDMEGLFSLIKPVAEKKRDRKARTFSARPDELLQDIPEEE